jgi:hypothetical protein
MSGTVLALPNTPSWRGAQLKHRDNFTFYTFTCALIEHYAMKAYWGSGGTAPLIR